MEWLMHPFSMAIGAIYIWSIVYNIVKLVGYYIEHNQHLLVYEYMSNGTLHDILHSEDELSKKFSWNVHVRISLGETRALEYLHAICQPSIVHQNFNSANILLDDDLSPHLSHYGMEAFTSFSSEIQVASHMRGSVGYSNPEFVMSGIYTLKSNVI
jgi:serine/threonine protein kinase